MQFDYSKLLGRLKEYGVTQAALATFLGISASTLSLKLNNKAAFSQDEIRSICELLEIPDDQIGIYFFKEKVQKV